MIKSHTGAIADNHKKYLPMSKTILILFLILFIACKSKDVEKIQLTPIEKFSDFGYDHFLSSLSSIEFINEIFYITEYEHSRLMLLNKDFSEKLLIDNSDKEFGISYPTYSTPINDKIAVYNSGRQKIDFYTYEGEILKSSSIKVNSELLNFAKSKNQLLYSIIPSDLKGPFVISDINSKKIKRFGELSEIHYNKFQEMYNSLGYIFPSQNGFLTLKPTTGELISYNSELKTTFKSNILEELNLNTVIEIVNEFYKTTSTSTMDIVSDCKLFNDKLYILIYNRKIDEKPNPREVVVFHIEKDGSLQLDKIYELGEINGYYSKICLISSDKLAAFEIQTSDIHIFDLK